MGTAVQAEGVGSTWVLTMWGLDGGPGYQRSETSGLCRHQGPWKVWTCPTPCKGGSTVLGGRADRTGPTACPDPLTCVGRARCFCVRAGLVFGRCLCCARVYAAGTAGHSYNVLTGWSMLTGWLSEFKPETGLPSGAVPVPGFL